MPWLVSLHEDMRDPVEVFSASGHEHAADKAESIGGVPMGSRTVYVRCPRGTVREVEILWEQEVSL